jgi:hypothetical protein
MSTYYIGNISQEVTVEESHVQISIGLGANTALIDIYEVTSEESLFTIRVLGGRGENVTQEILKVDSETHVCKNLGEALILVNTIGDRYKSPVKM